MGRGGGWEEQEDAKGKPKTTIDFDKFTYKTNIDLYWMRKG